MSPSVDPCFLCGHAGDRRWALVEWTTPIGSIRFTSGPRCIDAQACRGRVEASGLTWEVDDHTLPTVVPSPPAEDPPEPPEPSIEEAFA